MPRDGSGNYTLPGGGLNPVVTNTPITITWWNTTGSDLAAAMTDSLSRSGNGGMLGPFAAVDGTAGAPGYTFQSETTSGLYRAAGGEIDVSIGGTRYSRWTAAGFQESFDNGATWKTPLYNNNGNQTFVGGLDFSLGALTVASSQVYAGKPAVTKSSSSGGFFTGSGTYVAVTNASLSFTATGHPVQVQLVSDEVTNPSSFGCYPTSGSTTPTIAKMRLALSSNAGGSFFAVQQYYCAAVFSGGGYTYSVVGPSAFSTSYTPGSGAATLGLYALTEGGAYTATVTNCKLCITQF